MQLFWENDFAILQNFNSLKTNFYINDLGSMKSKLQNRFYNMEGIYIHIIPTLKLGFEKL